MGYFGGGGGSGSAGANTALSNLVAPTAVNATLLPGALGIDIGSSAAPFDEIFVGVAAARLRLGTVVVGGFGTLAGISTNFSRIFLDPGWIVGNGAVCVLTNSAGLYFSDTAGEHLIWYDPSQTVDTLVCAMGATSRSVLFIERGDEGFDFAHPQQTNPTLFIHSAAQSTTQWVSLAHSGVNAIIDTGLGPVAVHKSILLAGAGSSWEIIWAMSGVSSGEPRITVDPNQTGNAMILGVPSVVGQTRSVIVCDAADIGFNFATGIQTNPTLVITSANQSVEQRFGLRHNATQGQILDMATTAANQRPIGLHGGAAVASAATITPTGNVFHVTGTTNIDNITIMAAGTSITVIFDGILTVGDAGNLKLTAALVTTADDTLTLMSDGTNWYEVARAVN